MKLAKPNTQLIPQTRQLCINTAICNVGEKYVGGSCYGQLLSAEICNLENAIKHSAWSNDRIYRQQLQIKAIKLTIK